MATRKSDASEVGDAVQQTDEQKARSAYIAAEQAKQAAYVAEMREIHGDDWCRPGDWTPPTPAGDDEPAA